MADGEDKSLDDFFAKRDKKKKKDRGRKGTNEGVSSSASSVGPSSAAAAAAAAPAAPTPAAPPVAAAAIAVAPSVSATAGGAAAAGGGSSAGGTAPGNAGASGGVQAAASASVKKPKREREKAQRGSENADSAAVKEEEEWKEFEQKEADYSGLRIQALQISEENVEEEGGLEGKEDKDSDGEGTARDSERSSGVWSRQGGQAQPTAPAAKVAAEALDVKGVVGGVYRPPGARSGSAATPRRGPQKPPEITSESQFPSLQAAAMVETKREKELEKTFETVKHRGRAREDGQRAKGVDLELGNQFAVLGE
ncbi:protein CDV3 homolog [Petromyzon marinus]|uniref:protein CDV3 homolog n=1 Tax=Petromyzon marinus TaxID=7757 RepID=UPI003F70CF21